MASEEIKRLMEEFRTLEQSGENQKRKKKFSCIQHTSRDQWRGTPRFDDTARFGDVPVELDNNTNFWGAYLGYDVGDYYRKPEVFLKNYLRMRIERFKLYDDDTFLDKMVPIWMGSAFEASLLGLKVAYVPDADPWIVFDYYLQDIGDLGKIPELDFYHSGQMEDAIRMYEYCCDQLDDDFDVIFPEWERSPFGVATYIRGMQDVILDMATEEDDFVNGYLDIIMDRQFQYFREREKYLGKKTGKINFYNDEVNIPMVSPSLYRDYIRPTELKVAEHFGGFHYWHSCGVTDKIYKLIAEIPGIDMIHRGPSTSARAAGEAFGQICPIEVNLDPMKDVINNDEKGMYEKVASICRDLNETGAKGYLIRANNIGKLGSTSETIRKCRQFITAARKAVSVSAMTQ